MAEQDLKEKTTKGLIWGALNNGALQIMNLVFGIFLGRLLNPSDWGMVGMLAIFSAIAAVLQESGFINALAIKKEISDKDYNAVFWFSTGVSFLLYVILFFCAPLISLFYKTPELTNLARFSFLGFFIASLGISQSAFLYRNLKVKERAISNILALFISGLVSITMAFLGFAYWGLATQSIVYVAISTICYWHFSPWRPTLKIDFTPLKGMISFSCKLLATNIFNQINNNLFSIFLGKFYTKMAVGYFNQANKWCNMGHSVVTGMITSVAQPVLVNVTDDEGRQRRVFRKLLRFTAFVAFPVMFGIALIAKEVIVIAITDKWLGSVNIMRMLCIGGAFIPITTLYSNLIVSHGKSNIFMWNTICISVSQLLSIVLLYHYGITIMIIAYISINICWLFVWHFFVWRIIHLNIFCALKDIVPFAIIAAIVITITFYITRNIPNLYLMLIAKIVVAGILYSLALWAAHSVTLMESASYILGKMKKK
jgi:O-antigen/teichoic acid export membrane protein